MSSTWYGFIGGVAALAYLQLTALCAFIVVEDYIAAKRWGHRNTNLPRATVRSRR